MVFAWITSCIDIVVKLYALCVFGNCLATVQVPWMMVLTITLKVNRKAGVLSDKVLSDESCESALRSTAPGQPQRAS